MRTRDFVISFLFKPESRKLKAGFGLIEVVIAAAIIAVGISGILAAYTAYERSAGTELGTVQATLLAEEGVEAAVALRDTSWSGTIGEATLGTPYLITWNGSAWALTQTATETDHVFWRTVTFASVMRDGSDEIIASGGTTDPNTRLATVSVSWFFHNATSTVTLSRYVSNIFSN